MLGQSGEESGRLPSCPANNKQQQEKRKVCQRTRFSTGRELRMKAKEKIRKTHEERRSTAASEAERAAPRLDELNRPCLDERVKVLLKLRVCRKRVLDWVFLCQPQAKPWLVDQQEVSI